MPIFEISSQNGYLFSKSAYFHRVLINACHFLVVCSCVGTDFYFRPRSSFFFCPNIYSFSTIRDIVKNWSIVAHLLPTNIKHMEPTNPWEVFVNSWICFFMKRPCLDFGLYPVSIACLQSEIDISRYVRKSRISKFTSLCMVMVPFHVGCLILCECL